MHQIIFIFYTVVVYSTVLLSCAKSKPKQPEAPRSESVNAESDKPKELRSNQNPSSNSSTRLIEATKSSPKENRSTENKETTRKSDPSKGKALKVIKAPTPKPETPRSPYGYNAELIAMQEQMLSDIMRSDRKGSDREFSHFVLPPKPPPPQPPMLEIARTQSDDGRG